MPTTGQALQKVSSSYGTAFWREHHHRLLRVVIPVARILWSPSTLRRKQRDLSAFQRCHVLSVCRLLTAYAGRPIIEDRWGMYLLQFTQTNRIKSPSRCLLTSPANCPCVGGVLLFGGMW